MFREKLVSFEQILVIFNQSSKQTSEIESKHQIPAFICISMLVVVAQSVMQIMIGFSHNPFDLVFHLTTAILLYLIVEYQSFNFFNRQK
jgi:hypothetical protein